MSSADYWTNEPPIQIGEIELSPGATVCVGTEVTLALTDVVDFDTLHYCIEDNKEKTKLDADTSLTTYWTVMKDGEVYDEIEDKALAPSEPLKFTPKQPGKYAIEVYADDHPQEPKRNDDRTSTITAAITVLKVDLDGQELQPPPPPQNWKDVPDNKEVNPGVLLVNGKTKLLVQNPGANVGKYKISWPDLPGNKKLLLVGGPSGPNSPIEVDCAGPWPKEYMAVAAGNWDYSDSVEVTLTHSLVPCSDVVKLIALKVEILSVDATYPSSTKLKCRVEPSGVTLDSVDFKITDPDGIEIHSDSQISVSGDFEFTYDQNILERSAWIWDEDGSVDEIGPNTLKIIGHKGSVSCEDTCEGRRDTHWTAYAEEEVSAYFLVKGVGLRIYFHDLAESYHKVSYTVPFSGKDLWIGTSHIILDVRHPEDYSNISWGESHKYNNAGGDFGSVALGSPEGNEAEHKFYNGCSYNDWPDPANLKGIARVDILLWGTFGAIEYTNREVDRSIP